MDTTARSQSWEECRIAKICCECGDVGKGITRSDIENLTDSLHISAQCGVSNFNSFGTSGGARGIHDVRETFGTWRRVWQGGLVWRWAVGQLLQQNGSTALGRRLYQVCAADNYFHAALIEHFLHKGRRGARVYGKVGGVRLQNTEKGCQSIRVTGSDQSYHRFWVGAVLL